MRKLILIAIFFFIITCPTWSQSLGTIDVNGLEELVSRNSDTTYVVNFWATWCSPCVAEIEYFEELHKSSADRKLHVILINLDFPNQVERRLKPFIRERELTAPILNMQNLDYDSWIPLIDSSWSGQIPATLIFRKGKREFYTTEFSRAELFEIVNTFTE